MQVVINSKERDMKVAAKLRESANKMTKLIKQKMEPAIARQNHTARRARIASGMFEDGVYLKQIQDAMIALADAKVAGRCPLRVTGVTTKKQVEFLINTATYNRNPEVLEEMMKLGLYWQEIFEDAKSDMLSLVNLGAFEKERRRRELAAKERSLVGNISGYFPTPAKVVETMLSFVDIEDGDIVFDPSAGGGAILDVVKHYNSGAVMKGMEINSTLAQIAASKGHDVVQGDCLEVTVETYDIIMCNPPFEHKAAIDHISFYFDNLLSMGGTLVGITDSGAFSNQDSKSLEFQEFVRQYGYYEDLPKNSFASSGTNVNTCVVVLVKD